MNTQVFMDWFFILFGFSALAIAAFIYRNYATKYQDIKDKVHSIHALIELIDASLEDDKVTREEFATIIKKCLEILSKLL